MHALAVAHETDSRSLSSAPGGLGVGWIVHVDPFHRSANVHSPHAPGGADGGLSVPTAVHALAEVHETEVSALSAAPGGFGVGWTAQLVPSHRSASVCLSCSPTAVQTAADGHATPDNCTNVAPTGLTVLWAAQVAPSHRSTNGNGQTAPLQSSTAEHASAAEHDTLDSPLLTAPGGLIGVWVVQFMPSQLSANACDSPTPQYPRPRRRRGRARHP